MPNACWCKAPCSICRGYREANHSYCQERTFGPVGPILWKMRIFFKAENISWNSTWPYPSCMIQKHFCIHSCWILHSSTCMHLRTSYTCICATYVFSILMELEVFMSLKDPCPHLQLPEGLDECSGLLEGDGSLRMEKVRAPLTKEGGSQELQGGNALGGWPLRGRPWWISGWRRKGRNETFLGGYINNPTFV